MYFGTFQTFLSLLKVEYIAACRVTVIAALLELSSDDSSKESVVASSTSENAIIVVFLFVAIEGDASVATFPIIL